MSSTRMLIALVLVAAWSTGLIADDHGPVDRNCVFFAHQTPLVIAQADDEWGVSSGTGPGPAETAAQYKSPSRALMYSLLLPGLGEVYVGDSKTKAATFFAAEIGIWSAFVFYRKLGKWKEDDYIELAVAYAGIDQTGKSDFFFDMIGFYDNRDDYNKVSRVYTRTNPYFPDTPSWDWQWRSDTDRALYRDVKNDSKTAFRNANFALAVAALNRAAAAVFAWRSAKKHNRSVVNEFSNFDLEIVPDFHDNSVKVQVDYTVKF